MLVRRRASKATQLHDGEGSGNRCMEGWGGQVVGSLRSFGEQVENGCEMACRTGETDSISRGNNSFKCILMLH